MFILISESVCLNEAFAQTNPGTTSTSYGPYVNGGNFPGRDRLLSLPRIGSGQRICKILSHLSYYNLKDFQCSSRDSTTSLATAPQFTEALDLGGLIHMAQNMLTEATNDFTNAINSNPEFAPLS
ncbi:MAG: hypothetical protein IPL67_18510 [Ignavibacteria bacterium]|nr:hypothetical protein [Ignavibacteria bacterium]